MGYTPAWVLSFIAFLYLYIFMDTHGALAITGMLTTFFLFMCLCHKFLTNKLRWW